MEGSTIICLVTGVSLTSLSGIALWSRAREGTVVTAVGGLHAYVLLFLGIGMLAYVFWGVDTGGRVAPDLLINAIARCGPALAGGYLIAVIFDLRRRKVRRRSAPVPQRQLLSTGLLAMALGLLGYWGTTFSFANSGVGTIFPVLNLLLYPGLAIGVSGVSLRHPKQTALFAALAVIFAVAAFLSPWRSHLVMLGASVSIGYLWRTRRVAAPIVGIGITLLVVLPFAQLKKHNYAEVSLHPVSTFVETLSMSPATRLLSVAEFWAVRIDGALEMAYVENALYSGQLQLRGGLTYLEAMEQLIPRVLWPEKPSFK